VTIYLTENVRRVNMTYKFYKRVKMFRKSEPSF